ncbi:SUF system Fe-S cluster assembly protein [Thiorhodococcus minor]|uniref:SUF system Fe-S cluster assembly protein n=1 Tax=Thiorhodococcus minor TaxID=57489 RepID=A0A6M0JXW0_9GAMM|nr:SUF system Fe-S cluster assembly protein [Thiorhodococcus minor]NEV61884.1 SUF system Fe-S cluster assembly protein [Thiorhodococcus minor]
MNRLARFAGFGKKGEEQEETSVVEEDVVVEHVNPEELRQPIIDELRKVHDPEIPVNIYDLGLIYTIDIAENGNVHVDMTLTAPGCPVAGMMPLMVKSAVERVEGVGEADVALVWDPPWSQANMSDEARLQLGLM